MIQDIYDSIERGIEIPQTLYRVQQAVPPQMIDQSQPKGKKNQIQKKRCNYDSDDEQSDQNSSFESQDNNGKAQFLYNSFVKIVPKKNLEFKMTSEINKDQMLYAKIDAKNNRWLIYLKDPQQSCFKENDPQFILQTRTNKKEWVLWSTDCEKCYQKKKCQPYTDRRQWLMYMTHDVERETENAVNVLQILIPKSDDDLKQEVICPRTMDQKNSRFNYQDKDFSYFEFTSKENKLPEECFYVRTKFPNWNENLKSWVIDSYGRMKAPSKRNFQLLFDQANYKSVQNIKKQSEDKDIFPIYQMGKQSTNNYIVDYRHPMTFVQSFAVALCTSSWKSKL